MSDANNKCSAKSDSLLYDQRAQHPRIIDRTFQFRNLPYDIRFQIYNICLVLANTIAIVGKERSSGLRDLEIYENMECIALKAKSLLKNEDVKKLNYSNFYFCPSLIRTSKAIYNEAAPVLYGMNRFKFWNHLGWADFSIFHPRLSDISKSSIQTLHLEFPDAYRRTNKPFNTSEHCVSGMTALRAFTGLRHMHFYLYHFIMTHDLHRLATLHEMLAHTQVTIHVNRSCYYNVKISTTVMEQFNAWQWEVRGENFDIVKTTTMDKWTWLHEM